MHKKSKTIGIIIIIFFLILIFLIFTFISQPRFTSFFGIQQVSGCNDYNGIGDWIISDKEIICNDDLIIYGNLIINGSSNVTFNNASILIADSVFLNDTARLILNRSILNLNVTDTSYTVNVSTEANTSLILVNSTIKNNQNGYFVIDIKGYFDFLNNSQIFGDIKIWIYSDRNHTFFNSSFKNREVTIFPPANKYIHIKNITFTPLCDPTTKFIIEANATIENSIFGCQFITNQYANVLIKNSVFNNVSYYKKHSYVEIYNSSLFDLQIQEKIAVNFVERSNIMNEVIFSFGYEDNPKIYGNVDMPNKFTWKPGSNTTTRYYPIYIIDQFNRPLQGKKVNITRNTDGALISKGITNADGLVILNITFNKSNYCYKNFTLNWNGSTDISLYNDTPIIIIENVPDNPPVWSDNFTSPPSPTNFSAKPFNFSIVWSDETNESISIIFFENNFSGIWQNYSVINNCKAINATSINCKLSFSLSPGTYMFGWHAIDLGNNSNSTPLWFYEVINDSVGGGGNGGGSGGGGAGGGAGGGTGGEGRGWNLIRNESIIKKLEMEGCMPVWNCSDWGNCINGFMERDCTITNMDELYSCIKPLLPLSLVNVSKEELFNKIKLGELANYSFIFAPPLMKKECQEEREENRNRTGEKEEREIQLAKCVTPVWFFILLFLYFLFYIFHIFTLYFLKEQKKEQESKKSKKEESKKEKQEKIKEKLKEKKLRFILSVTIFFILTFLLIALILIFKCPEWYLVTALAILLYIVSVALTLKRYIEYWHDSKSKIQEREE